VEVLDGGLRVELAVVVGSEGFVFGGVFARDDDGSGVHAMSEGVEAGGGFAFGGAGAGRFLGVETIRGDLSSSGHEGSF
jgi:hypothetical protein